MKTMIKISDRKIYFDYYNNERSHHSLDMKTPAEVYFNGLLEQADLSKNKGHSTGLNQT